MDNGTEKVSILRFNETGGTGIGDVVAREAVLTIILTN